jgi:hypothetical protein
LGTTSRRAAAVTIGGAPAFVPVRGGTSARVSASGGARLPAGVLRLRELKAISALFGRAGSSESDHYGGSKD